MEEFNKIRKIELEYLKAISDERDCVDCPIEKEELSKMFLQEEYRISSIYGL